MRQLLLFSPNLAFSGPIGGPFVAKVVQDSGLLMFSVLLGTPPIEFSFLLHHYLFSSLFFVPADKLLGDCQAIRIHTFEHFNEEFADIHFVDENIFSKAPGLSRNYMSDDSMQFADLLLVLEPHLLAPEVNLLDLLEL